jgi:hypothetical protein
MSSLAGGLNRSTLKLSSLAELLSFRRHETPVPFCIMAQGFSFQYLQAGSSARRIAALAIVIEADSH